MEKQDEIEVTPVTLIPPQPTTNTHHTQITSILQEINLPIIEYTPTTTTNNEITILNINNEFKTRFFDPAKLNITTKQLTTPFTLTFNTNTNDTPNTTQSLCELLGNVQTQPTNNEYTFSKITQNNKLVIERTEKTGQQKYVCHHLTPTQHTEICIFENITTEVNKTQFVDVLQRLFRHNLRNDLNVIKGHAEKIRDQATDTTHPGITDSADTIYNKTTDLVKLGAETQLIRDVINNNKPLTERNLHSSIKTVINDKQSKHPNVTFNTSLNTNGRIAGTTHIEDLVDALISNAITHNTHPITVTIETRDTDTANTRQLRVTDNGPGIPQNEKDIILGNADITSLNHASGLGLWVVRWIADEHGANITFTHNKNTGGTTVTINFQTPNTITNT